MQTKLFNKTELFIREVQIDHVNLDKVAGVVADVLGLEAHEVLVVDARADLLTLDLLRDQIDLASIAGKEQILLNAVDLVPGVRVTPNSHIHSEGVLGMINLDPDRASTLPASLNKMATEIEGRVAMRALVLPSGEEVISGKIQDTNTPFLINLLNSHGYSAESGKPLPDDVEIVAGRFRELTTMGFGLVVTTGGTGAEHKDCMVEAIQTIDPDAATPYVVYYQKGQGRHLKDGVRLAVGRMDYTTFVALTGPHQEVLQVAPLLIQGYSERWSKWRLAKTMAASLRNNWEISN